jgi:hypothetical protein
MLEQDKIKTDKITQEIGKIDPEEVKIMIEMIEEEKKEDKIKDKKEDKIEDKIEKILIKKKHKISKNL